MIGKAYENHRYHNWLLQEHEKVLKEVTAITSSMEQVRFVQQWRDSSSQLLEALAELVQQTPQDIRWTGFTFVRNDQITLKGTSPETPKVFDLVAQLRKSPRFLKVEARRTTKKKSGEEDVIEFEILCTLVSGKKDREERKEVEG